MATVIRHDGQSSAGAGRAPAPIAFNFDDMNDRANEYLETVRRESAKIVQQAHQQAEQVRRQAEAAGRAAAEEVAYRVLEEKIGDRLSSLYPALDALAVEFANAKAEWQQRWEQSAVSVAAAIAERVIRREIAQQPKVQLEWISEALRLASGTADITLHLNPADYELLGKQVECLTQSLSQLAPARIVADAEITPGGCVVKTNFGEIDQQIETQLARIQEELA